MPACGSTLVFSGLFGFRPFRCEGLRTLRHENIREGSFGFPFLGFVGLHGGAGGRGCFATVGGVDRPCREYGVASRNTRNSMTVHSIRAGDHREAGVDADDTGHDSVVMSMVRENVSGIHPLKLPFNFRHVTFDLNASCARTTTTNHRHEGPQSGFDV